jgi:hypothetical protein
LYFGLVRSRRDLQRLYSETWEEVKRAVDEADPEGLLALGSPGDEYEDAVAHLTRCVLKGEGVDERTIAAWFADNYGMEPGRISTLVSELRGIGAQGSSVDWIATLRFGAFAEDRFYTALGTPPRLNTPIGEPQNAHSAVTGTRPSLRSQTQ